MKIPFFFEERDDGSALLFASGIFFTSKAMHCADKSISSLKCTTSGSQNQGVLLPGDYTCGFGACDGEGWVVWSGALAPIGAPSGPLPPRNLFSPDAP